MNTHDRIGEALLQAGVIDAAALARAIEAQATRPATLGKTLADLGLADEDVVARTVAAALHLEFHDGERTGERRAGGAAPGRLLPQMERVPAHPRRQASASGGDGSAGSRTARESDVPNRQEDHRRSGHADVARESAHALAPPASSEPVPTSYDMLAGVEPAGEVEAGEREVDVVDPATLAKDTNLPPIVRLVNLILSDAAAAGASDIHIEPQESLLQVRQRVDGLLREVLTVPAAPAGPDDFPLQDHVRDGHRRAAQAAGRPQPAAFRGPADRSSRLDAADAVRREDRHPAAELGQGDSAARRARILAGQPAPHAVVSGAPAGHDPRDRADRQRQDVDALRGAQVDQVADQQHHHAGGSDRAPGPGRQSDADQRQGRRDVRQRPAVDPAPGSQRDSRRRDSRPGDGRASRFRPRRPAICCSARCTPTTRRRRSLGSSTSASSHSSSRRRSSASSRSGWCGGCARRARCRRRRAPRPCERIGGTSRLPPDGQWVAGRGCEQCGNPG